MGAKGWESSNRRCGAHRRAKHLQLLLSVIVAAVVLLAAAPAAFAAAPTCQDDPFESTQAGAPVEVVFQCSPSTGLTYQVVSGPSHGTLDQSNISSGEVGYTAANSFSGTDSFTFKATDASDATSNIATVTIAVSAENQCSDESNQTPTGQGVSVFLGCESGTNGTETLSIVSGPSHGTLGTIDQADQTVQYTPAAGYNGPDSFTYKANDGVMTSASATVTLDVGNACSDQTVSTTENSGSPAFIAFQCNSANNTTETYSLVSQPGDGHLSGLDTTNGEVEYQPAHNFVGTDSFTFQANDGSQTSNTATITIDVTPPPPSCQDVSISTAENTAVSIPLRCTSAAGATMTLSVPAGQGPAHGTLGAINSTTQTVTYTPTTGFASDPSTPDGFEYIATDSGSEVSQPASVSIQVGISCVGNAVSTNQNDPVQVSLQCQGPSGVPLTLATVGQPAHGTLGTVDQSGDQVLYTPVSGFHGNDSFTFDATGGGHTSVTVTVPITVKATTLSCSGADVSTLENQAVTVPATCTNRAGTTLTLSTAPSGAPADGALTYDNTNQTVTYTPSTGFTGADQFTYVASDGSGATPTATVNVTVGIACQTGSEDTTVGQPVTVALQCLGPDDTPLTLAIARQPTHGVLGQIQALESSVEYTPNAGYTGTDTFTYTASGGGETTPPATITITVGSATPQCSEVTASTAPGAAVTIPLECGGPAGTTLSLAISQPPANGTLGSIDTTHRTVTYTPDSGFVGSDEFQYHASGGGVTSEDAFVSITVGPTCEDDSDAVAENQPTEINLDCFGPRGQELTLAITGQPLHGTLGTVDSAAQQVLYTPAQNYVGPDGLTYQATAGSTTSNVATESLMVEPPGQSAAPAQPPACQGLNLSTAKATALNVPLSCVDPAGKTLTLFTVSGGGPSHGTLGAITQGASPGVDYTPIAGFSGTDSFSYEASNGSAVSAEAEVTIQVGLTCSSTSSEGEIGQAQQVQLMCAGPGTPAYQIVSGPTHGTLGAVNGTGVVTYTPQSGFAGADSFTYKATAGGASSNTATAFIDVTGTMPSCQAVSISTPENTAVSVPLNCSELGATLTLSVPDGGNPPNGSLSTINQAAQTVTYTPATGFEGTDQFSYEASDGNQLSEPVPASVTVGLSCSDNSQQVAENQPLTIDLACTAPNGTTATISVGGQPSHGSLGSVDQSAQSVVYTPDSGFTGTDSFTIQAAGGGQTSQTAVVSLDVRSAPPACNDIDVSTPVSTAVSVPLQCTGASGATLTLLVPQDSQPDHGALGAINQAAQTVQYTPNTGFSGTDFFSYEASDGNRLSDSAAVTITISNGPTCTEVDDSTNEGSPVSVQLSCSGGNGTLAYAIASQPGNGALTNFNASTGAVTYTPTAGFSGVDSFTYDATAGGQTSSPATVAITVIAPPTCQAAGATTNENVSVAVQLSCVDSAGRTLTLAKVSGPSNGTLGTIDQATQTVQYTPASNFHGIDTFTYDASAGGQTSTAATATITVNQAPGCQDVQVATDTGHAVSVPLSCTDPSGRTLTLSTVTTPSSGTLGTIAQNTQTVQYTPNTGFHGTDSFTYKATATGGQSSNTATVSITVNTAPTCSPESSATTLNQPVKIQLSCTGGSGALTLASGTGPAHGTLGTFDQSKQTVQYTPGSGYSGSDSFTYQATDADGVSAAPATVTLNVTVPPPGCSAATASTPSGHGVTVQLSCTDAAGRTMTLATGTQPAHGTLGAIDQAAQTVQYTPNTGFSGTDSFTYHATAGGQVSADATVTITVTGPPTCAAESPSTTANQPVTIKLSCTGGNGALTLSAAGGPAHGTLGAINQAAQTVQYTPNTGFSGTDSFTYAATDTAGLSSAPATVTITIAAASAPPPPAPPSCHDEAASTPNGQAVAVTLSCTDAAGRALTLAPVGGPAHGTLAAIDQSSQTVIYTPAAGFSGADSFTYSATAAGQSSNTASVSITVAAALRGGGPKLTALHLPSSASVTKGGVATIPITFAGTGNGTLTLSATVTVTGKHHRKSSEKIGSAGVTFSGAGVKTLHLQLNATGRSLLNAGHGRLVASLNFTFAAGAHATVTGKLTLKAPKPKKKKKK